ncbi:trans-sialidase [Trypanosoma cruzi]|nr:trans-sialidase [Trypanosoma cruzi]
MSRRLFTSAALLLLLVVLMCCGIGGAATAERGNGKKAVDALLGIKWDKLDNREDVSNAGGKITSLRVPGLVKVGDDVFAVAEAQCGERMEPAAVLGFCQSTWI